MSQLKLAVIGAGALGSRHLQALAQINAPVSIQVVDPSQESLSKARELFHQVEGSGNVKSLEFVNSLEQLAGKLDVVVVATGADVRKAVVEELLNTKSVRYFILEKVLFQNKEDFVVIDGLLMRHGAQAWVNCPRRMWPFYRNLQQRLINKQSFDLHISGSQWGIGCNAIHFIDLLAYLTGGEIGFKLNLAESNLTVINSRRPGFIDFTGSLNGSCHTGHRFTMQAYPEGNAPVLITILCESLRCIIRESEGKAWISESPDWKWEEISFTTPYQSQLTQLAVQQLITKGECDLTPYDESWQLHIPMLEAFLSQLQNPDTKEVTLCPIT